jgi:hypothetical protein
MAKMDTKCFQSYELWQTISHTNSTYQSEELGIQAHDATVNADLQLSKLKDQFTPRMTLGAHVYSCDDTLYPEAQPQISY